MNFTLYVWRQRKHDAAGAFETIRAENISEDSSFLEMLDSVNQRLAERDGDPIAFDSDCREGICGSCSLMINGEPHGPEWGTATCQLHMRSFLDDAEIWIEPWRAAAFPVIRDLVTDRTAFDRIIQAGGFVSVSTGPAPDGNAIPVPKPDAERAMDAAQCIGCGACVAACRNASAMLFVAAKAGHLGLLPQGKPERLRRAKLMVDQADAEGFGACTNQYECEAACPKSISVRFIADLNRDYVKAGLLGSEV